MPTPLYDTLVRYAQTSPARFHMPGHKGFPLPAPELAGLSAIDVTEIPGTGNLYEAGEPFDSAQKLWADRFGFDYCQFLTGGSTMGVYTGMTLFCQPGDTVLVDRACHRSVYHALALLDLNPVFWERPWQSDQNLIGAFSQEDVDKILDSRPEIKTACITSPTYSGLLSDIEKISAQIHARGGKLFVDGAHGAHLPFLGVDAFSGADGVVVSAHKTLPAMGQSALLFTRGVEPERVRRTASLYGSSSPSYPMLASLDLARQWLEDHPEAYQNAATQAARLRKKFPSVGDETFLRREGRGQLLQFPSVRDGIFCDPTRLTLKVQNGPAFASALEGRGIYPEMSDSGHVVLICTAWDSEENFHRLETALEELWEYMGECPPIPAPPLPQRVLSPRQALFSPQTTLPLSQCEGRISACQLAPYPPGVPVVAPGEVISKKELSYFTKIEYNNPLVQVVV